MKIWIERKNHQSTCNKHFEYNNDMKLERTLLQFPNEIKENLFASIYFPTEMSYISVMAAKNNVSKDINQAEHFSVALIITITMLNYCTMP